MLFRSEFNDTMSEQRFHTEIRIKLSTKYIAIHQSELWRRTNHCVSRTVSFPTQLVFKLKNALSRWKSRVEMPRI